MGNEYRHPLFYVWHDADLYPAYLLVAGNPQDQVEKCDDDISLRDKLQEIFASAITTKLITALMAQADE